MCTGIVGQVVAGQVAGGALVAALECAGGAVQDAWSRAWQYVRASRIGGCTELDEGALEYAEEVAQALGTDADTDTGWQVVVAVLDAMDGLL